MKHITLLLVITAIISGSLHAQSVYGFTEKYFCSYDLATNEPDTVLTLEYLGNKNFRSAIDRYNGRFFYGGGLSGLPGKFHIIDLVTLEIQSYPMYPTPDNMEYDFAHDRIVFETNGDLYYITLDTVAVHFVANIENSNGFIWGHKRTYNPHTEQYMYADYADDNSHLLVINVQTGVIECDEIMHDGFAGLVMNQYSGEIMGHHNGRFGFVDACSATLTPMSQVPDYYGALNAQMAVYNHLDSTYILPFALGEPDYRNKLAIIDIYHDQILEIRDHAWDGRMNMQQIYDKPVPPIIDLRDTLFVPKGESYRWYRDDIFIGATDVNYWVPQASGTYSAVVDFKEYTALSLEREVTMTTKVNHVSNDLIHVYPNPVAEYLTIEYGQLLPGEIRVHDITGNCIVHLHGSELGVGSTSLHTSGLPPGVYFLTIASAVGVHTCEVIKI